MEEALIWLEIGNLYVKMNAFDEAIGMLEKARAMGGETASLYQALGIAFYHKGVYEKALACFEKGMQLSNSDAQKAEILKWLGDLYVRLRKYRRAAMVYETSDLFASPVTPLDADMTPPPAAQAESVTETFGIEPARAETPPPFTVPPNSGQPFPTGGNAPLETYTAALQPPAGEESRPATGAGSGAAASENPWTLPRAAMQFQVEARPATLSAWEPVAVAVAEDFQSQPAQTMTELVATADPLALQEPALREPKEIEVYRAVTQANPGNDRAWYTLGNHLLAHHRAVEAMDAYRAAVSLRPELDVYHYQLGLSLAAQRKFEEALGSFHETIRIRPENFLGHAALAGCYRHLGRENDVRRHAAIVAPYMQKESNYNRACFEAVCGNKAVALDYLRQAVEKDGASLEMVESDPDLDFIREEPGYKALVMAYTL